MDIFKKLNLKNQTRILVLNAPPSFEPELAALAGVEVVRALNDPTIVDFVLAFVTQKSQIEELATLISAKAAGDALVWFSYPKGSSKKYHSDINRDTGWEPLGRLGFEPVRQVAIDEDWSALRFRRVEYIKKLSRSWTISNPAKNSPADE